MLFDGQGFVDPWDIFAFYRIGGLQVVFTRPPSHPDL